MPELPEVETVCRTLDSLIRGEKIVGVDIRESRLRYPVSADFSSRLRDRSIRAVERRGKYILTRLDGDTVWISHLGMSGRMIVCDRRRVREKHDHLIVLLADGREIRYHDPRRFGFFMVARGADLSSVSYLARLGPDPFDRTFGGSYLRAVALRSRRRIRDLLLDQEIVAGLGNIYVNEILFRAGIRPTRRAWRIASREIAGISAATRAVLRAAIRWRGTSIADYRDGEDRVGEFQHRLKVYDKSGRPCPSCGRPIKRVVLSGRSAFYCPSCQS
jgi:formamidopyrimidine-DNA glycosylase